MGGGEMVEGGQQVSGCLLHLASHSCTVGRGGGWRGGEENGQLRAGVRDKVRGLLECRHRSVRWYWLT